MKRIDVVYGVAVSRIGDFGEAFCGKSGGVCMVDRKKEIASELKGMEIAKMMLMGCLWLGSGSEERWDVL